MGAIPDFSSDITLRIGLLEDDDDLRQELEFGLRAFGFTVHACGSSARLYGMLREHACDILVLDVNLPGEDGYSVAARIRAASTMGIIMLTGRTDVEDRVRGLQGGADVFLIKPVDMRELAAVLQALARRIRLGAQVPAAEPEIAMPSGWGLVDNGWTLVAPTGASLPLSAQESIFLSQLLERPGRVVERERLARAISPDNPQEFDLQRINMLVSRLRSKASADGIELPLRAVRGQGYVFAG